jgi:hypothetical protein
MLGTVTPERAETDVRSATCPRCGYDLTGAVVAWPEDRCPAEGLCSECGLAVRWGELLGDPWTAAPWLYEAPARAVLDEGALRRWLRRRGRRWRTLGRSPRPYRFWRSVPLAAPIRGGRLLRYAALWLAAWYLAMALFAWLEGDFSNLGPYTLTLLAGGSFQDWVDLGGALAWPFLLTGRSTGYDDVKLVALLSGLCIGAHLLMTVVFLTLGPTMAAAKVRHRHVARPIAYGLPIAVTAGLAWVVTIGVTEQVVVNPAIQAWYAANPIRSPSARPPAWTDWAAGAAGLGPPALFLLVTWLHWHAFASRYLRLRRAALIVTLGLVIAALGAVACVAVPAMYFG